MLTPCPEEIYLSPERGMSMEVLSEVERMSGKCWEGECHHACPLESLKPCATKAETTEDHGERNKLSACEKLIPKKSQYLILENPKCTYLG